MSERTAIEAAWGTAGIDPNPNGKVLGAYKCAAHRCGCSLEEWIARRTAGERRCYRCRTWKPITEFSRDGSRKSGRYCVCIPCNSHATTAARYGMTWDELIEFKSMHNNQCGICGKTEGMLHVDHDHSRADVKARGLLCPSCNSAIGSLREDPRLFAAAIAYLEKSRG